MKINAINNIKSNYNKSFKSLRTDKNTISILKNGENPLLDNTKFNIYAALSNISKKYPEKENIEFLLDIADNLEYGQGGNSEFKDILDEDGVTEGKRENTDWSLILKDTVKRALKRNNDEDINDLIIKYSQTFETKKELTENQKKILELRENLTENLISDNITEDSEELERTTRIRKNLDYFISSSEISGKQKEECLEKFIYFMSDEYKINPQLTGKKKQVLDEVLNDIVIKTPDEEILKTKKVDQIFSGICASISVCRKLMAYEDKSGYVDLIMEELKDSPKMSVYDITQLGTGKKVDIPKADIDYTRAMYLGYRIIDNAAHLWMQNAHTIGDGTRVTEKFVGIDNDNYGIFDDSSWYEGLPEERKEEKNLLKALIKENEFLENVSKTQKEIKHSYSDMISVKKDFEQTKKQTLINLENILNEVFPSSTDKENRKLITNLCEFYSGQNENNEVNVAAQLPDEVKQKIVSDYIIENTEQEKITPESGTLLKEKAPEIIKLLNIDKGAEKALNGIKNYSSVNSKYNYSKNLFKLAAAHRIAIENDINLPNGIIRFEKFTGLPPRDEYVSSFLNTLKQSFSSETVRKKYANGTKDIPSQKELELELMKDSASVESYIPQNLDNISKTYLGADLQEIILESYRNNLKEIENGNDEAYENIIYCMDLKDDKSGVIKHLNKWISKLSDNPSKEDVSEAIRNFGFTDRFNMLQMLLNTTYESINNSYSPDKAKQEELLQHFSQGIQNVKTLEMRYNSILSKWNVPSQQAAVLNNLEKEGFILSRNNLNSLSATFDRMSSEQINNIENVENGKEQKRQLKKLRSSIPDKDKRILNSIEKSFPNIKAYAKNRYRIINTTMRDDLDKQYAELGMLSGSFWVREEGSSGLLLREQIRILEQMTGKPYYIETDVNNAVKKIKQGTGSGILESHVDNTESSAHAQYIPLISREKFTDFATGKKTKKDVLWTDNSWGKSEKKSYWNGRNGFNYTDYKSGYGWDKGYIAADDFKIGLPVEDMTGAVGYNKKEDYSFPLVDSIIISGNNTKTYKNLFKVFNEIISMNNYNIYLDKLEDKIKSGEKVDIKTLSSLDKLPEAKQNQIHKKLEQDFDKLDDELKFMFDKLSV
ncbi:MAG: hypothetical protein LUG16_00790, partial [Candidatus Gastranaerophilales bacterium]|nr:hypothetical protein [Candidatus Gastranaerophilales bacterium]